MMCSLHIMRKERIILGADTAELTQAQAQLSRIFSGMGCILLQTQCRGAEALGVGWAGPHEHKNLKFMDM